MRRRSARTRTYVSSSRHAFKQAERDRPQQEPAGELLPAQPVQPDAGEPSSACIDERELELVAVSCGTITFPHRRSELPGKMGVGPRQQKRGAIYRCHARLGQTKYKKAKAISEASVQSSIGSTVHSARVRVGGVLKSRPTRRIVGSRSRFLVPQASLALASRRSAIFEHFEARKLEEWLRSY